ncbi:MAG TPA: hypothetical protein VE571_07195 [Solirubrobacteraceae bacterium]|nr:hypothetical protein [Solirubrobacteraceae bacterium]
MEPATALNLGEMQRYLNRVGDRWPLQVVMLGGARVDDARGAPPQRERGPEFIVVLVSRAFEGMPWLERVYQATSLWDGMEMGDGADVHCYTLEEFQRRRITTPALRAVAERGILLYEDSDPLYPLPPDMPRADAAADGAADGSAADGGAADGVS